MFFTNTFFDAVRSDVAYFILADKLLYYCDVGDNMPRATAAAKHNFLHKNNIFIIDGEYEN
jgi:hypothetical protein